MLESNLSVASSLTLLIMGLTMNFFIFIINKNEQLRGLFLVAIFDATTSLLTGLVVLIGIWKTINLCSLTYLFLNHAMLLMPIINGTISTLTWNYQCWTTVKSQYKTKLRFQEVILGSVPQLSVSSLFILGLFTFTPQNENEIINYTQPICMPSTILSYTYTGKCEVRELFDASYHHEMFNKFLQDTNKTKSDLLLFNNDKINGTDEIIQTIYRLVEETVKEDSLPLNQFPNISQDSNIMSGGIIESFNEINYLENIADDSFVLEGNKSIYNHTSKELAADYTINNVDNIYQISLLCGSLSNQNELGNFTHLKTLMSYCDNYLCNKKCYIKNHDEKVYLILLILICYLIPSFGAIVFYYRTVIQTMIDTDDNIRTINKTLIRSSKWAMILPIFLLSPSFFCFFMEIVMCSRMPQWLTPVLTFINQVYSVMKNVLNIAVLKQCINNQVHPLIDEEYQDHSLSSSSQTTGMQENQYNETTSSE